MATFSYQTISYTSTGITFTAPTGGVLGDGLSGTDSRGFFWVKNAAAGGTIQVLLNVPGTTFGVALPDIPVSIPDGEERLIGPIVGELGDPAALGGVLVSITPNVTGVTAATARVA